MQFSKSGRELGWLIEYPNGRIGWASLACVDTNEEAPVADPVNAANARLIAAAPDLLEALRCADAMLSGANMDAKAVKRKVSAALAKVEASK